MVVDDKEISKKHSRKFASIEFSLQLCNVKTHKCQPLSLSNGYLLELSRAFFMLVNISPTAVYPTNFALRSGLVSFDERICSRSFVCNLQII